MTCSKQSLCFVPSAFRAVANLTWILADSDFTVCSSVCSAGSMCNFIFWLWIYVTWHSAPVHFWENSVEKLCELFSNSVQMFFGVVFFVCVDDVDWEEVWSSARARYEEHFIKELQGTFILCRFNSCSSLQLLNDSSTCVWWPWPVMSLLCHFFALFFFFSMLILPQYLT